MYRTSTTAASKMIPPSTDTRYTHQGIDLPLPPVRAGFAVRIIYNRKTTVTIAFLYANGNV